MVGCPFRAEPEGLEESDDLFDNYFCNLVSMDRSTVPRAMFVRALYPDNADECTEVICDNGEVRLVDVRVFMSLQKMFTNISRECIQSLMLEHKDAMMKKEAEWLTKMENEKIELGKQISIRDQMVLEARAETNEYKSMNQSILSQISDKEAKIAQVSFSSLGLGINPSSELELQT